MPLALIIVATLATGVVLAIVRSGKEEPDGVQVLPTPTDTLMVEPSPTTPPPSPEPTEESPEPTTQPTESPEPTAEPTVEPTAEPTESPGGPVLADTGGPTLPFTLSGAVLLLAAAGLWRLSRRPA